jgi:hypothetical protein
MTTFAKDFGAIKSRVVKSLYETLHRDCNPPPDDLIIFSDSVKADKDKDGWATAQVIYVMYMPSKKTHSVNIRFQYDNFGRFILSSMEYV